MDMNMDIESSVAGIIRDRCPKMSLPSQGERGRPRGGRELGMNMEENIHKAARMPRTAAPAGPAPRFM